MRLSSLKAPTQVTCAHCQGTALEEPLVPTQGAEGAAHYSATFQTVNTLSTGTGLRSANAKIR